MEYTYTFHSEHFEVESHNGQVVVGGYLIQEEEAVALIDAMNMAMATFKAHHGAKLRQLSRERNAKYDAERAAAVAAPAQVGGGLAARAIFECDAAPVATS